MSDMRAYFEDVAAHLRSLARPGEVIISALSAEQSDFIRFNRSRVRQATAVRQVSWTISLIRGRKRLDSRVSVAGSLAADKPALASLLAQLRDALDGVPDDPFLLFETAPAQTHARRDARLPDPSQVIDQVLAAGRGIDLVGFYASGPVWKGFANSLGVRHWHAVESFNFGWCLYHDRDKAVKTSYAGSAWESAAFEAKMRFAREQLARLAETPRELAPGAYRAFLAPAAVTELLGMMSWAGFGLKSRNTKQSALIRMIDQGARLSPLVTIAENTHEGIACGFQAEGFVRPPRVPLVEAGALASPLVSPRSAREFGVETNGANAQETPESLDLAPGTLPEAQALEALDTGIYVGNLWYLNFSDRSACRLTGMTRFASFWVEGGRIRAPLNVMRFDDTAYRLLGENLEALTRERDVLPDTDTYGERSTVSVRTPGALLRSFALTL
ncbi:MAG TPA: metallopeptidase TldD-related protein [Usitatibacter sp.]|nr:metallopeptidase TldD-related protein [Usitatibacter sp.]